MNQWSWVSPAVNNFLTSIGKWPIALIQLWNCISIPKGEKKQTKKPTQIYLENRSCETSEAGINETKLLIGGQVYELTWAT